MCIRDRVFTNDAELIELGASYLRIISVSYLCWSISEIYLAVLRSIERVRTSTALNVTALMLNIFLNAVFVYGWFGAPKLGIRGVALATSISRAVQLVLCFWVSAVSKDVKIRLRAMFEKGGVLLQDFIRLSLPALGNDILWSVAFSMYSVIMGPVSYTHLKDIRISARPENETLPFRSRRLTASLVSRCIRRICVRSEDGVRFRHSSFPGWEPE